MKVGALSSRSAALIAPKVQNRWVAWLEVSIIMLGTLATAAYVEPGNPLLINEPFSWVWLAPTLLALRHGTLGALAGSVILGAAWVFFNSTSLGSTVFPGQYFLGGLILSVLAGEFSDIWRGRLKRVRAVNNYLDQRLEALTRRHYLLKHDFERLEQSLLRRPVALRESLAHLRDLVVRSADGALPLPGAQDLLGLLAQTSQLEAASLHVDLGGRIQTQALATLGNVAPLDLRDPLVMAALQNNRLAHVQSETLCAVASRYLAVAPLLDTDGCRHGLLAIERMPFLSLNIEALQFLNIILGYYTDLISMASQTCGIIGRFPHCPMPFASELLRLERIYRDCNVTSTLVALRFEQGSRQQQLLFSEAVRQRRQLDMTWPIEERDCSILMTLMPLYEKYAVNGYLTRVEGCFRDLFGTTTLSESGIRPIIAPVGKQPAGDLLNQLLVQCHGH